MTRHKKSLNVYYHADMGNIHAVKNFKQLIHLASQENAKELVSDYQKITDIKENKTPDQKTMVAEIGEKLHEFKDWLYDKVDQAKEYFQAKSELDVAKQERKETNHQLDKVVAIREEREALQKEHAQSTKAKEQEKTLQRDAQGIEKGGFEMEL
jgi:predicted  nucleic acid-binding Zn-ribbon protein